MHTLWRIIKFAFQNLFRNFWLSAATITIVLLTLISVNFLITLNFLVNSSRQVVEDKIDLAVYFNKDVAEDKILGVKTQFEDLPEVKNIRYISRNVALEEFKEQNGKREDILKALEVLKENPFLASLVIQARSPEDYSVLMELFEDPALKDVIAEKDFTDYKLLIDRITTISKIVGRVGLGATMIFVFLSLLIIFNAIRVSIYTHREEIGIMRLVGASNRFIRWPFFLEGVIYSLIAVALSAFTVFVAVHFLDPYLQGFFGQNISLLASFREKAMLIFGGQFIGLSILNILAAGIAMKKYLRT